MPFRTDSAIALSGVGKGFARRKAVLRDVDLDVCRGELFGLLGPNGVGKTTLLKMMATLVLPDRGTIRIDGIDAVARPMQARSRIGFCSSEDRSFYFRLTARQNLRFFGALAGLRGRHLNERIEQTLAEVALLDAGDRRFGEFSSGMRQRLVVARALLGDPPILLFDEPTRAVDPIHADELHRLIRNELVERRGKTVVFATNLLHEAWSLCDRVAVVNDGAIAAAGTPSKIGAIFVRDARCALAYPAYFHSQWLSIGIEVTIAYYLSMIVKPSEAFGANGHAGSYFTYLVISFAFVTFQNNAMLSFAESVREGQTTGTLEAVLATPTNLSLLVLGTGTWSFALTLARVAFYFLLATLFGLTLSHVNWLTAAVFIVLTVAAVSPIGVFAAAATMAFKKTGPLALAVNSATTLFGGVYLPLAKLPLALQIVGALLPISHALIGIRGAFYGATLWDLRGQVAWMLALTAVLLPSSLYVFARTVHRGRRDGTLGQY